MKFQSVNSKSIFRPFRIDGTLIKGLKCLQVDGDILLIDNRCLQKSERKVEIDQASNADLALIFIEIMDTKVEYVYNDFIIILNQQVFISRDEIYILENLEANSERISFKQFNYCQNCYDNIFCMVQNDFVGNQKIQVMSEEIQEIAISINQQHISQVSVNSSYLNLIQIKDNNIIENVQIFDNFTKTFVFKQTIQYQKPENFIQGLTITTNSMPIHLLQNMADSLEIQLFNQELSIKCEDLSFLQENFKFPFKINQEIVNDFFLIYSNQTQETIQQPKEDNQPLNDKTDIKLIFPEEENQTPIDDCLESKQIGDLEQGIESLNLTKIGFDLVESDLNSNTRDFKQKDIISILQSANDQDDQVIAFSYQFQTERKTNQFKCSNGATWDQMWINNVSTQPNHSITFTTNNPEFTGLSDNPFASFGNNNSMFGSMDPNGNKSSNTPIINIINNNQKASYNIYTSSDNSNQPKKVFGFTNDTHDINMRNLGDAQYNFSDIKNDLNENSVNNSDNLNQNSFFTSNTFGNPLQTAKNLGKNPFEVQSSNQTGPSSENINSNLNHQFNLNEQYTNDPNINRTSSLPVSAQNLPNSNDKMTEDDLPDLINDEDALQQYTLNQEDSINKKFKFTYSNDDYIINVNKVNTIIEMMKKYIQEYEIIQIDINLDTVPNNIEQFLNQLKINPDELSLKYSQSYLTNEYPNVGQEMLQAKKQSLIKNEINDLIEDHQHLIQSKFQDLQLMVISDIKCNFIQKLENSVNDYDEKDQSYLDIDFNLETQDQNVDFNNFASDIKFVSEEVKQVMNNDALAEKKLKSISEKIEFIKVQDNTDDQHNINTLLQSTQESIDNSQQKIKTANNFYNKVESGLGLKTNPRTTKFVIEEQSDGEQIENKYDESDSTRTFQPSLLSVDDDFIHFSRVQSDSGNNPLLGHNLKQQMPPKPELVRKTESAQFYHEEYMKFINEIEYQVTEFLTKNNKQKISNLLCTEVSKKENFLIKFLQQTGISITNHKLINSDQIIQKSEDLVDKVKPSAPKKDSANLSLLGDSNPLGGTFTNASWNSPQSDKTTPRNHSLLNNPLTNISLLNKSSNLTDSKSNAYKITQKKVDPKLSLTPTVQSIDQSKLLKVESDEVIQLESNFVQKNLELNQLKEELNKTDVITNDLTKEEKELIEKKITNNIKPTKSFVEINGQKIDTATLLQSNGYQELIKQFELDVNSIKSKEAVTESCTGPQFNLKVETEPKTRREEENSNPNANANLLQVDSSKSQPFSPTKASITKNSANKPDKADEDTTKKLEAIKSKHSSPVKSALFNSTEKQSNPNTANPTNTIPTSNNQNNTPFQNNNPTPGSTNLGNATGNLFSQVVNNSQQSNVFFGQNATNPGTKHNATQYSSTAQNSLGQTQTNSNFGNVDANSIFGGGSSQKGMTAFSSMNNLGSGGDINFFGSRQPGPTSTPANVISGGFFANQVPDPQECSQPNNPSPGGIFGSAMGASQSGGVFGSTFPANNSSHNPLNASNSQAISQNPLNSGMSQNPLNSGMSQNPLNSGMSQNPLNSGMSQNPLNSGMSQNPFNSGMFGNNQVNMFGGNNGNNSNQGMNKDMFQTRK